MRKCRQLFGSDVAVPHSLFRCIFVLVVFFHHFSLLCVCLWFRSFCLCRSKLKQMKHEVELNSFSITPIDQKLYVQCVCVKIVASRNIRCFAFHVQDGSYLVPPCHSESTFVLNSSSGPSVKFVACYWLFNPACICPGS